MTLFLKYIFWGIFVRFISMIVLGIHVRNRKGLPRTGPAVIVANHNSHLDTLVLMSMFCLGDIRKVRPVAASDYFNSNRFVSWFSREIIGIVPIQRKLLHKGDDVLGPCYAALDEDAIIIVYPEGTRGEPEELSNFKKGIARIAEHDPQVPVIPVFLRGLGKALPKNECVLVPFFCDMFVGKPLQWCGDRNRFMESLVSFFKHKEELLHDSDE